MNSISGDSMKIKTEWSADPSARKFKEEVSGDSKDMGAYLNGLSGEKLDDPYKVTRKKELDKDAFLKMFMTQLKYQDPTSPVDNEKMAQQMAMFSQLEQSVTTNQYLEKILTKSGDNSEMAFSMIGKNISANKAALLHNRLEHTAFDVKLPQDTSELKVEIMDEVGEVVQTIDFGKRPEGSVQVRWDGKTHDGRIADSGRYFYKVNAQGVDGNAFVVEDKIDGRVTGVSRANGETVLMVGERKVSINEVNTVTEFDANKKTDENVGASPVNEQVSNVVAHAKKLAGTENETNPIEDTLNKRLADEPRLNALMPLFMR